MYITNPKSLVYRSFFLFYFIKLCCDGKAWAHLGCFAVGDPEGGVSSLLRQESYSLSIGIHRDRKQRKYATPKKNAVSQSPLKTQENRAHELEKKPCRAGADRRSFLIPSNPSS